MLPGHELEFNFFLLDSLKLRRDRLLGAVEQWQLRLRFSFEICTLLFLLLDLVSSANVQLKFFEMFNNEIFSSRTLMVASISFVL